jgi:hypothetical protein
MTPGRPATAVVLALAIAFVAAFPAAARADVTGFLGVNTTPANRPTKGFAVGMGLLFIGFEFEYASADHDARAHAPSMTTGLGNVQLQTPVPIFGLQPYFTTGGGVYRERLDARQETGFATNVGGGVKVSLAGPIRLRADYRVFKLGSGALFSPAHRVYVGLNLSF